MIETNYRTCSAERNTSQAVEGGALSLMARGRPHLAALQARAQTAGTSDSDAAAAGKAAGEATKRAMFLEAMLLP
jgi:hypothetical protein